MGDTTPPEQPLQSLQVGSLQEGFVPPNLVRPATEVKITKPDEGKGMVPPSLVQLPVAAPSPPTPPAPVPSNVIPPVQSKPPQQGKPHKK